MKELDRKSELVYRWVRAYIEENKFSSNTKIPSETVLTRKLSVSRETVRRALSRLAEEGLLLRVKGSGTYINKEEALSWELGGSEGRTKIGLILQGQDGNANSSLMEGIRSILPPDRVDLRIFLTDNKFANERRCLQAVVNQGFQGFIVDGVKASLLNPNLDYYQKIYQKRIPVIFYNNYYKNLKCPRVVVNDLRCAEELIGLLIRQGHRHIAGIFLSDNYQSIEKFQGMAATLQKNGVEYQDDYVKWCASSEAYDARSIGRFLKRLPLHGGGLLQLHDLPADPAGAGAAGETGAGGLLPGVLRLFQQRLGGGGGHLLHPSGLPHRTGGGRPADAYDPIRVTRMFCRRRSIWEGP